MRALSKDIIEKIESMSDDKKDMILDGLAKLYAVRPYRASQGINDNDPPAIGVAVEVNSHLN
jgi:hypothetical protein